MSEVDKSGPAELAGLASEINEEHRRCEEALRSGLAHALRAGELLEEAKRHVNHGEWGAWLAENFEGSERTAQAYMKVRRGLPKLESENPQRVADLSFRGALKELTAPTESAAKHGLTEEETGNHIRELLDLFGLTLSKEEGAAVERRLAAPGSAEEDLLTEINVENLYMMGAVVAQDGFFFVPGDNGEPLIEYRSENKDAIYREPLPITDEALRGRVRRGCRVHAIIFFKTWRHLSNWLTKVVIAECGDLAEVEARAAKNADWRHAEPAGKYLREALFGDVDRVEWAQEHGVSPIELRETLAGVETWVSVKSHRMEQGMMSTAGP